MLQFFTCRGYIDNVKHCLSVFSARKLQKIKKNSNNHISVSFCHRKMEFLLLYLQSMKNVILNITYRTQGPYKKIKQCLKINGQTISSTIIILTYFECFCNLHCLHISTGKILKLYKHVLILDSLTFIVITVKILK